MTGGGYLALDFDGVVWDSVDECFEVGVRAWEALGGPRIEGDRAREAFRRGRHLCRTGPDFQRLLDWIRLEGEAAGRTLAGMDLERFRSRDVRVREDEWDRIFYGIREEIREGEFDRWAGWQCPMPGMISVLPRWIAGLDALTIATAKDTASVERLLETAGIRLPVLGKEVTRDKGLQVTRFAEEHGVRPEAVLLLDDVLENLEMARRVGAGMGLATWGYNELGTWESGTRDSGILEAAVASGIHLVDREGMESRVLELCGELKARAGGDDRS